MSKTTSLDPSLRRLLDAERSRTRAPRGAKEASFARLAAKIPIAGPPTSKPPPPPTAFPLAAKGIVALVAVGLAIGTAGVARTSALPAEAMAPPPLAVEASTDETPASLLALDAPRAPSASSAPAAPLASAVPAAPRAPAADRSLAEERALLDVARLARARGDDAAAIAAATAHERRFPEGQLAEERDAILVQALAHAHRLPEARARAERLRARAPHSMLLGVVSAALEASTKEGAE